MHMQCISAVKLIKFILNVCISEGFHAQNRLLSELRPGDKLLPKKSTFVFGFWPQFLALGASSLFVTPIGYAYVRVSNNKQQITPEELKQYKPNWSKRYKNRKGFWKIRGGELTIIIILHFS